MVEPQASRFWQAATRSGLLDEATLRAAWDAVPPEKRTHDAIDRRLARQVVNAGKLTLWQAQQILAGRWQGLRIDRYELRDVLGQGGMGRVYLAQDTRLKRRVALKILSRERMNNPRALTRFGREAKVGAQLQHENLVRIYDEGEALGVRYLVMEYIQGKTVGQMIADVGRLPPETAADIGRQVSLGLEHLHQKGLLHRDVNPMNILVDRDGTAKLTDLGLAIDLGDMEDIVTRDGATVGTFDYISPEQARHSRGAGPAADLYSLGCSLYHMISGRVPFPTPSLPEKLYAHQITDPEPLTQVVPGVPEGLAAVVARLMKKAPEERFASAADAARALEPFASGVAAAAGPVASPSAPTASSGPVPSPPADSPQTAPTHEGSDPDLDLTGVTPGLAAVSAAAGPAAGSFFPKIDLGPEPSLSELRSGRSAAKPKSRTGSRTGSKSGDSSGSEAEAAPGRPFPIRAALVGSGVLAAVAIVALLVLYRDRLPGLMRSAKAKGADTSANPPGPSPAPASSSARADIAIRYPDGKEVPQETLREAIGRLGGGGGEILVRSKTPLNVGDPKAPLRVADGHLVIRAADEARPELAVLLGPKAPWIEVSPRARLTLSGLSIRVTAFVPPDAKPESAAMPMLLKADGDVTLDRCLFSLTGDDRSPRAVSAQCLAVRGSGCVFEGFDRPIIADMYPGAEVRLSQCQFVRDVTTDPLAGWAVTASRKSAPQEKPRKLAIDRCTALGAGLLAAEGFTPEAPLTVSIENSAVRTSALLLTSTPLGDLPKAILWTGKDNAYALNGAAWIVTPPKGFDSPKGGPTDVDSWLELMKGDKGAKGEAMTFAGPATSEGHPPEDYAVVVEKGKTPPGANPEKVGPGAKP